MARAQAQTATHNPPTWHSWHPPRAHHHAAHLPGRTPRSAGSPIFQTGRPRHSKVNGTCGLGLRAAGCGLSPPQVMVSISGPGTKAKQAPQGGKRSPQEGGHALGCLCRAAWAWQGPLGQVSGRGRGSGGLTLITRGLLLDHGQRGAGGRLAQGVAPALLDLHLQFGKRGRGLEAGAAACAEGPAARHCGARPIRTKRETCVPARRGEAPGKGMAGSRGGHFR